MNKNKANEKIKDNFIKMIQNKKENLKEKLKTIHENETLQTNISRKYKSVDKYINVTDKLQKNNNISSPRKNLKVNKIIKPNIPNSKLDKNTNKAHNLQYKNQTIQQNNHKEKQIQTLEKDNSNVKTENNGLAHSPEKIDKIDAVSLENCQKNDEREKLLDVRKHLKEYLSNKNKSN